MQTKQSKAKEIRRSKEAEEQEKLLASLSTGDRELVEALLRDYPLLSVQKAIEILRVSGM